MEEQEETIDEGIEMETQINCGVCASKKHFLTTIRYNLVRTQFQLVCASCGSVAYLNLQVGMKPTDTNPEPIVETKRNNYVG